MNILDWIVIAILGGSVFVGYQKGLIKTLFDFISMIVAFVLTYLLYPTVSMFLYQNTNLHSKIAMKVQEALQFDKLLMGAVDKESQINSIGAMGIPRNLKESLIQNNNDEVFRLLGVDSFEEYVSHYIATTTMNLLVIVILFITIMVLLAVVVRILDLIAKLPVLKEANKGVGGFIGFISGMIVISLLMMVISSIITLQENKTLLDLVENGSISKWIYENNPLENLAEIKNFLTTKLKV